VAVIVTVLAGPASAASRAPGSPAVTDVAFSPDGTLLACGYGDGTVRLWVVATGQVRGPVLRAGTGAVTGVAFSPDGTLLAASVAGGTIGLWDPATGRPSGAPLQAGGGVTGVAFSRDGTLLASGGADGTVRLWDPVTGLPSGSPLQAGTGVNGVAFGPDGKLASADANGAVKLWTTVVPAAGGPDWLIVIASVIAIVLAASAVTITTREIRRAASYPGRTLWTSC
jgi:WD40 repeat protein